MLALVLKLTDQKFQTEKDKRVFKLLYSYFKDSLVPEENDEHGPTRDTSVEGDNLSNPSSSFLNVSQDFSSGTPQGGRVCLAQLRKLFLNRFALEIAHRYHTCEK